MAPQIDVKDLLTTTTGQRNLALARPFIGVALFVAAVHIGWWALTPLLVFGIFVAVVTVTHDVVHRTLGLGPRGTDWALFLMGCVLLESGHAYRLTHLQHHRRFPDPANDPEGYPADITLFRAVLYGPVFLIRLWFWAWSTGRDRVWLLAEAIVPIVSIVAGALLWTKIPGILVYVTMAIVGSWVYPLLTVYLPHHHYGDTPLRQTRTLRGRLLPAIFLELTYHLEHHLYPQVPSHNLARLSRRLDPILAANGVIPVRVP